jgi:hypothetical protein
MENVVVVAINPLFPIALTIPKVKKATSQIFLSTKPTHPPPPPPFLKIKNGDSLEGGEMCVYGKGGCTWTYMHMTSINKHEGKWLHGLGWHKMFIHMHECNVLRQHMSKLVYMQQSLWWWESTKDGHMPN